MRTRTFSTLQLPYVEHPSKIERLLFSIFIVVAVFLGITSSFAQVPPDVCAQVFPPPPTPQALNCAPDETGADWLAHYRFQNNYIPGTPLNQTFNAYKTIRLVVNIWNDDNGAGNYQNNTATITGITDAIAELENMYHANLTVPSDPVLGFNYESDTKIRFELVSIRFWDNTAIWNAPCVQQSLYDAYNAINFTTCPECRTSVNLHIIRANQCGGAMGFTELPVVNSMDPVIAPVNVISVKVGPAPDPYTYARHWAHELGHTLDLLHTYWDTQGCFGSENLRNDNLHLLEDVFGPSQLFCGFPVFCTWGQNDRCYFIPLSSCDAQFTPLDNCHNNVMSNNAFAYSTSTQQIGRMHRTLKTRNTSKYAWGYDPQPYYVQQDETWDFRIKFYQDIVVPAGVTLTVKCEVQMVPQAQIIVELGGKLIVDGGTIREAVFSDARWKGIIVYGNNSVPQNDPDQGVLELINGGTIQGANVGALVIGGGIVRAMGSTPLPVRFMNCANGVVFANYLWPTSPWTYANNASYFHSTHFEVDNDFIQAPWPDFHEHARLHMVYGIRFRSCTFLNSRTNATTSAELGHGIRAQDAHFFASSGNRFEGLDHGIHATGTASHSRFEAHYNVFKNNICGIYMNSQHGCQITSNRFVMGLRQVQLTGIPDILFQDFHRGIFTHECNKLWIEGNVLERDTDPLAIAPVEGVVIGYVREANEVVNSNTAFNIERGFVGEGINAHTNPTYTSIVGLQFLCNSAWGNSDADFWSRPDASVPPFLQWNHSIRAFQGDVTQPADNRFGTTALNDYRVTTTFTPITYFHRAGTNYTPVTFTTNWLIPWLITAPPPVTCPIVTTPPPALMLPDKEDTWTELYAEKLAYGNLRYQYMQLLDGGDQDEVVAEITGAWPQDFLELRDYLLARSPYLSVDVLREMMLKQELPEAIKAEIIIANPEAAQRDGFIRWLTEDCPYPLPEYLVGAIVASWEVRTYRATLEGQMAQHHARHEQAAMFLLQHFLGDSVSVSQDSVLHVWQQVRTPAARYAEANLLMDRHAYTAAADLITDLPVEHKLRDPDVEEQQRMLQWISFREALHNSSRGLQQLEPGEVDQLETLIGDAQDRPAVWIANTLCFHYERCRPVHTGGEGGPKSLPYTQPRMLAAAPASALALKPNPAQAWVAVDYKLSDGQEAALLMLKDALGRPVLQRNVAGRQGQVVLDLGAIAKGAYVVELRQGGTLVAAERLVVQ